MTDHRRIETFDYFCHRTASGEMLRVSEEREASFDINLHLGQGQE